MATVTLGSNTYTTYVSVDDADDYLAAALHAVVWASATATQKGQAIVTATRMLDRQIWQGEKTSDAQALAWPRSGVTTRDGAAVDEDTIPQAVIDACCELAAGLLEDPGAQTSVTAGSNIKRVKAEVEVEFFGPRAGGRFPQIIQELVGQYLRSPSGSAGSRRAAYVSGQCEESSFDDADQFTSNGGG